MNFSLSKKIKFIVIIGLLFVVILTSYTVANTLLEDGTRIEPSSELVYYIDVVYDGIDEKGNRSNGTNIVELYSGEITVSDKLPAGLEYLGVVESESGMIGAVMYNDETKSCLGHVVDDVDGVSYDEATSTVSFVVKDLQAGCKVTVGIRTKAPNLGEENRKDFYNTAQAQEGVLSVSSNTVHVWMGQEDAETYTVKYQIGGDVIPDLIPALPANGTYTPDSIVSLAAEPFVEGYEFLGWTSDVTITYDDNGNFTMPSSDVVFTGTYKEKEKYDVVYNLGDVKPDDYVAPTTQSYYLDSTVEIDTLEPGTVIDGYRFLGWETEDVTVTDGKFAMPEGTVTLNGSFEEVKYNVSYAFQGSVLPPNSDAYLPETKAYAPGEIVSLDKTEYNVVGYEFVGWYYEDNFTMPEEDVVIYGEWIIRVGYFEPTITISAPYIDECIKFDTEDKCYIKPRSESVYLRTTITNNEDFPIYDVVVDLGYSTYCSRVTGSYTGCTILDSDYHSIQIDEIPAGGSVTTYGYYYPYEAGVNIVKSELLGALADNNYTLTEKEYIATQEVPVKSLLTICNNLTGVSRGTINQYMVQSDSFTTSMIVKDGSCGSIFLAPGEYNIKQLDKQDYGLVSVEGVINTNNGTLVISEDSNKTYYNIIYNNEIVNNKWYRLWDREANLFEVNVYDDSGSGDSGDIE